MPCNTLSIIVIGLIITFIGINANNECIKRTDCSCSYPDGYGYDLADLAVGKKNFLITPLFGNLNYYFHPCGSIIDVPENITNASNYSIGVYDHSSKLFSVLGVSQNSFIESNSDTRTYLIYKQEKNITTIRLVCVNINEDHLYVYTNKINDNESHAADLILYSRHACRVKIADPDGMSTGSLLLVTFFIIVFGYLFIGMALKYFLIGARGIEIIPNISFWRSCPSRIGGYIDYLRDNCSTRPSNRHTSPNPDSYVSI